MPHRFPLHIEEHPSETMEEAEGQEQNRPRVKEILSAVRSFFDVPSVAGELKAIYTRQQHVDLKEKDPFRAFDEFLGRAAPPIRVFVDGVVHPEICALWWNASGRVLEIMRGWRWDAYRSFDKAAWWKELEQLDAKRVAWGPDLSIDDKVLRFLYLLARVHRDQERTFTQLQKLLVPWPAPEAPVEEASRETSVPERPDAEDAAMERFVANFQPPDVPFIAEEGIEG